MDNDASDKDEEMCAADDEGGGKDDDAMFAEDGTVAGTHDDMAAVEDDGATIGDDSTESGEATEGEDKEVVVEVGTEATKEEVDKRTVDDNDAEAAFGGPGAVDVFSKRSRRSLRQRLPMKTP